jgi:protein gp37
MAENTKIEWCDHTFNPWTGCTKVSPGCQNCYAEALSKRTGRGLYQRGVPRVRTSAANWKKPLKWNDMAGWQCPDCKGITTEPKFRPVEQIYACEECEKRMAPYRPRVFCASLADWLDDEVPIEWLADLLALIHDTPNLDWLLLTKRPENWSDRIYEAFGFLLEKGIKGVAVKNPKLMNWIAAWLGTEHCAIPGEPPEPPANVWIGTTVEDQKRADQRIPELLRIPAKVRFLSCEPLLGPLDLSFWLAEIDRKECGLQDDPLAATLLQEAIYEGRGDAPRMLHWVICGGESGPGSRAMHPDWARGLRDQCQAAGVKYFFKQWGDWVTEDQSPADIVLPGKSWMPFAKMKDGEAVGDLTAVYKVGKKAAGRLLDGRTWDEVPV